MPEAGGSEASSEDRGRAPDGRGSEELAQAWEVLAVAVRERVEPGQFETWFRRAALVALDDERVALALQNDFTRDWLRRYYLERLQAAVTATFGGGRRVELEVDPELTQRRHPAPPAPAEPPEPAEPPREAGGHPGDEGALGQEGRRNGVRQGLPDGAPNGAPLPAPERAQGHAAFHVGPASARPAEGDAGRGALVRGSDVGLHPKYTFENFVVGPCNRFAHAAALGAAQAPGRAYNPLFLHGNVGLGKTHLLQSLCFTLLETWPGVQILYLSCETFVNHFISALDHGDMQRFRDKYRNVDVLVVDDIHLLANKERTQDEFFHTYNTLYNAGRQIILSSDSPPKDIPSLQDRLVSRFKWGLVTELEPPCFETRMAILKRKSRERGHELDDEVAKVLAERIDTNIRELEGAITKLLVSAGISNQAVTMDLVRTTLSELFVVRRGQPTMDDIIGVVTASFNVKLSELQSKKRTNAVVFPRQIAMYLARKITRLSLHEIGGYFGGRDHATVHYAVEKIERLVREDEETRRRVEELLQELDAPRAGA